MEEDSEQFSLFKDCIAQRLFRSTTSEKDKDGTSDQADADGLDEFASYIASEAWPTLPLAVKEATHETRDTVPDPDTIPLESTSTSFSDSLVSYGLVPDEDDALVFLRKAVSDFLEQACAPPPVWSSTRADECAICSREVPLTYHHLIPRSVHDKVLKKGWHPKAMLNKVAWLCR